MQPEWFHTEAQGIKYICHKKDLGLATPMTTFLTCFCGLKVSHFTIMFPLMSWIKNQFFINLKLPCRTRWQTILWYIVPPTIDPTTMTPTAAKVHIPCGFPLVWAFWARSSDIWWPGKHLWVTPQENKHVPPGNCRKSTLCCHWIVSKWDISLPKHPCLPCTWGGLVQVSHLL